MNWQNFFDTDAEITKEIEILADRWGECPVGQFFPEVAIAFEESRKKGIYRAENPDHYELFRLGCDFSDAIYSNNKSRAMDVFHTIFTMRKNELL